MKKETEKKPKVNFDKKEMDSIMGECHDGEDYKVKMKDGSVKILSKEIVDNAK